MKFTSVYVRRIPAIITAVYFLSLVAGTHWPQANFQLGFEFADKALHTVAYAGLAALCRLTWMTWPPLAASGRKAGFFFLMLLVLGAFDELTQIPIPGRFGSVYDWIADGFGVLIGLALFQLAWPTIERWLGKLGLESANSVGGAWRTESSV